LRRLVNVGVSLFTFLAATALTARVITDGPLLVLDRQFFVDPFNVFLVALTAFVGFTTSIFSQPYMRIERDAFPLPGCAFITACTSCSTYDAAGAAHQQHGHPLWPWKRRR
jgi:formate hydrogenlyase subunit 3/multisubunit Na+/H+ antiporter MnhD subunit